MTARLSQRRVLGAAIPLLALAACARETPIDAAALPAIRAGAWTFEGTTGQAASRGRVCLRRLADTLGRSHAGCSGFRYSRDAGGSVIVRDRCVNPDGARVETRMRLAGDWTARFAFEEDIRISPPDGAPLHTVVRIDYRYVGPCPPS